MEEVPILGRNDDALFKQFQARYDVPAYVRRARQVEETLERLLESCRQRRAELADQVRSRLSRLHALAGDWDALRPWLADDEQVEVLRRLQAELRTEPNAWLRTTSAGRPLRRALAELRESLVRHNQRWQEYLAGIDLTPVNEARDGYNRYYLLEKECALRSPHLARQGFRHLEPLTVQDVSRLVPPLPLPRPRS